jgi:hypothetical protein
MTRCSEILSDNVGAGVVFTDRLTAALAVKTQPNLTCSFVALLRYIAIFRFFITSNGKMVKQGKLVAAPH